MRIREITDRNLLADSAVIHTPIKPLSPEQQQVKVLTDRSKQLKNQAKQLKARQSAQRAQAKLTQVNQSLIKNQ